MEVALQNLDRRMLTVEQILPTLATKQDLERFATKQDLERFATKVDLRDGIAEAKRHTDVLVESVRDDIRIVAEAVATLVTKVDSLTLRLETKVDSVTTKVDSLTRRLETKGVI
jgi:hypothetical protein